MSRLVKEARKALQELKSLNEIKDWETIVVTQQELACLTLDNTKNWIVIETYGTN